MEAVLKSPSERIVLANAPVGIGRLEANQVVLADPQVSRRHAEIWPLQHGYSITDKGSTTGTFVNGRRLTADIPYLLTSGDEIRIGQTTLAYEEAGSDARDDQLDLQDGRVPEEGEHIKLYYQQHSLTPIQERQLIARLAPGTAKTFVVQFLVDPDQADPLLTWMLQATRHDLEFFLRSYPSVMSWEFAVRRCDTWGNLNTNITWWYCPSVH